MTPALEIRNLSRRFGGLEVTRDLSFSLPKGGRLALIGPNGAGKTTLLNQLSGLMRPDRGRILLGGRDITRLSPAARARRGLGRTHQINQLFGTLTPAQSLALALSESRRMGAQFWRGRSWMQGDIAAGVAALAARFGLQDQIDQPSARLPYGRQRMLELAIALAGGPSVLLLDEPAAGVPEHDRQAIMAALASLPPEVAVILIEHDMDLVFSIADHVVVMVDGRIFAQGPPQAIRQDTRVREVYLGEGGLDQNAGRGQRGDG